MFSRTVLSGAAPEAGREMGEGTLGLLGEARSGFSPGSRSPSFSEVSMLQGCSTDRALG